jgi:hypothetical protein
LQASSQQGENSSSSSNNKAASVQRRNFSASISTVVAEASISSESGTPVSPPNAAAPLSTSGGDVRQETSSRSAANPTTVSENTETPTKAGETERSSSPVAAVVNTSEEPFLGDLSRGAKVFRAGGPPTARQVPSQAAARSEESWERSRISVRRITTAAPLQGEGRAGRREDLSDEPAAVSSPAPAAASQQQQRGRVRLNASTLGLYQKNHPSPRNASPLSAVRGGGGDESRDSGGQLGRPGVGAAALRADRVRFKVR